MQTSKDITVEESREAFRLTRAAGIRSLAYVPKVGQLASVSDDGTLRTWPAQPAITDQRFGGVATLNSWAHPTMSDDGRFALA